MSYIRGSRRAHQVMCRGVEGSSSQVLGWWEGSSCVGDGGMAHQVMCWGGRWPRQVMCWGGRMALKLCDGEVRGLGKSCVAVVGGFVK